MVKDGHYWEITGLNITKPVNVPILELQQNSFIPYILMYKSIFWVGKREFSEAPQLITNMPVFM